MLLWSSSAKSVNKSATRIKILRPCKAVRGYTGTDLQIKLGKGNRHVLKKFQDAEGVLSSTGFADFKIAEITGLVFPDKFDEALRVPDFL